MHGGREVAQFTVVLSDRYRRLGAHCRRGWDCIVQNSVNTGMETTVVEEYMLSKEIVFPIEPFSIAFL